MIKLHPRYSLYLNISPTQYPLFLLPSLVMAGRTHLIPVWILVSLYFTFTTQNEVTVVKLHVESVITHRFSTTHVTSVLVNEAKEPREVTFDLRLPKAAFISNFSMTIDGEVYPGEIAGKEKANKIYNAAVDRGQSAGYVRVSPRQSTKFAVSVNVAATKNVTFDLVYQELLQRRLGLYEHVIYIDPGQIVEDLMVEVYVVESRVITDLSVPRITNDLLTDEIIDDTNEYAHIDMLTESSAYVSFWPTPEEQERISSQGVSGQFIVNYDVEHESDGKNVGEILVSDGYFVHYFAPVWLEPLSKQIMFVLDTSGSMSGTKLVQMKQAMETILSDLSANDEFGIITFSSDVKLWKDGEMLPSNKENIRRAKDHTQQLYARGGTNIDSALRQGIHLLETDSRKAAMLIFLTDGQATSGETNSQRILGNIRELNEGVSIFCLGFGQGADFSLLQRISAQNNGVARKIYEDADATLQLAGFYDEISSPLLSDLKIRYIGDAVDNGTLTETNLHCLFDGAEMVVAGRLNEYDNNNTAINKTAPTINFVIEGDQINNTLRIDGDIYLADTYIEDIPKLSPESINKFTQRLWVYLTIKQLIDTSLQSTSPEKVKDAKARALELSLKYGFVTPFTSMVVIKPGDDDDDVREVAGGKKPTPELYDDVSSNLGRSYNSYSFNSGGSSGPSGVAYSPAGSSGSVPQSAYSPSGSSGIQNYPMRRKNSPGAKMRQPTSTTQTSTTQSFRTHPSMAATITTTPGRPTSTTQTSTTQSFRTHPSMAATIATTPAQVPKSTVVPTTRSKNPAAITIAVNVKHSTERRVNVCFDIPESTAIKPTYSLIRSNIDLTGTELRSYEDGKKFQNFLLKTANRTVEFSTKGVKFDTSRTVGWWSLKFKDIVDGEVLKDGSLKIYTGENNSSVTVNKHGIKSRRSRAKPFLTLKVDIPKQQRKDANGLLGKIIDLPKPSFRNTNKIVYPSMPSEVYKYILGGESCYRMTNTETIAKLLNL